MFTYTVIPMDLENWPKSAISSLPILLRVVRRFLITGEIHFFSDFPKHHEDVLQYVNNFISREGNPEEKDPVFGDFYKEFHLKAESVPLLPWRWRWAEVRVSLSSALWPGTVQVRGSRETLGKSSLCEKAALAIANQVSIGESVQCLEIPGSLKELVHKFFECSNFYDQPNRCLRDRHRRNTIWKIEKLPFKTCFTFIPDLPQHNFRNFYIQSLSNFGKKAWRKHNIQCRLWFACRTVEFTSCCQYLKNRI